MQTCLIRDLMKVLICCQFCPSHGLCFPVEYIQLAHTCKPLIIHFSYDLLFFIYYWKVNSCLWSASDANHFMFLFSKFSFTFVVLCSSLLWRMLQRHLDSCIHIGPPDPSLKLFLAVMPTEDFWCAKSFVPLADKAVSLYTLSISIYCPHLDLCFLWGKSCLFALCLCDISHNGAVIYSGNSPAFNGKYNKHY